jgi:hypothetical protein
MKQPRFASGRSFVGGAPRFACGLESFGKVTACDQRIHVPPDGRGGDAEHARQFDTRKRFVLTHLADDLGAEFGVVLNFESQHELVGERFVFGFGKKAQDKQTKEKKSSKDCDGEPQVVGSLDPGGQPDEHGRGEDASRIEAEPRSGGPQMRGKQLGKIDGVTRMDSQRKKAKYRQQAQQQPIAPEV